MLDKKYNFTKSNIEDKLNSHLNVPSTIKHTSYNRIGSHKRITIPMERNITTKDSNSNTFLKNTENNNHIDLCTFLDDDLIKNVEGYQQNTLNKLESKIANKHNTYNPTANNNNKYNDNFNIRPINRNKASKKMLNNSIMFDKFEESNNRMDESKLEESMLIDFED